MRWERVSILLISNILPSVMQRRHSKREDETVDEFKNQVANYEAFHSRIKVFTMDIPSSTDDDFPYTEEDLAFYMLDYIIR